MSAEIPKPNQLPAVVDKPVAAVAKVSDKDLDAACASLGLVRFRAKTIKALKTVGEAMEAADIARIQAANVVITQEKLGNLSQKLEEIIDRAEDDQTVIEAVRAATAVCAETNRAFELAVRILETKLLEKQNEASKKFKGLAPGETARPIMINVGQGGSIKVEGQPDE